MVVASIDLTEAEKEKIKFVELLEQGKAYPLNIELSLLDVDGFEVSRSPANLLHFDVTGPCRLGLPDLFENDEGHRNRQPVGEERCSFSSSSLHYFQA